LKSAKYFAPTSRPRQARTLAIAAVEPVDATMLAA
jgi:hypothetical protein